MSIVKTIFFGVFMTFFERLQSLMNFQHLTQKQLADDLSIRQNTISDWKNKGNLPQGETAIKLAQYFNVTLDYLLTGEEKNNQLSPEEIELLSNYRSLQNHDKAMISIMIAAMASESHKSDIEVNNNAISLVSDFDKKE